MNHSIEIGIVGASCRLPGAEDEAAFRAVLNEGRFTVGALPKGRWHPEILYHPGQRTPGSAYVFNGGYLPRPYDFDIGVFGMSPREAVQVDPQQRLLAELVWEALEDARIPPASVAGKDVGVYIGVSALDHANLFGGDPGAIESHFMTGNTLSIVANRISYLFDFKGPSFIVDTACSSSLVAVERALADLRSGRVETAVVGGVNMLLSPGAFVGFSRAQMLSPTGACRPFSASADGYVRSEGGVVFVLQRADVAAPGAIRARLLHAAVNSDGRTSGIALPGFAGQRALLELAYDGLEISPDDLAFVEAHGTGTAVGDPIEVAAIGTVLGQKRERPLPIGSVKSNIGHLEPASGVAGMMKALIALDQRVYPRTLHLDTLSPSIDFADLNVQPAAQAVALGEGSLYCGVSSFGFGGTNAHVVLGTPTAVPASAETAVRPDVLVISSQCKASLAALAGAYADRLEAGADPVRIASQAARGRALLRQRAVLPLAGRARMAAALRAFADGARPADGIAPVVAGSALSGSAEPCFVYNGNGAQWAGMGRDAYLANEAFRAAFDAADAAFVRLGFESLASQLHAPDLAELMRHAAVAQPLIFAVQLGVTAALAEKGLRPAMVLGHSVGEIAAAHVAGMLSLGDAARILAARARSQEDAFDSGRMAAFAADRAAVVRLIADSDLGSVTIAADNSPGSVTVSGPSDDIAALMKWAKKARVAGRSLDVAYPYHSPLLDPIELHFRMELGAIQPHAGSLPLFSGVTGARIDGDALDADYWWQNIRHEVRFREAVQCAAAQGATLFVEIGPRMILANAVSATLEAAGATGRSIHSLSEGSSIEAGRDPFDDIYARAVANGFDPPAPPAVGVDRAVDLPRYPWQRKEYAYSPTNSAVDIVGIAPRHPLIGARLAQGVPEWRQVLDAELVPYLADHKVGGEVVVPATALAEMALAVAREVLNEEGVAVEDFDIVQALILAEGEQREISVRHAREPATVEIFSRPRFGSDEWTLHAVGRITGAGPALAAPPEIVRATHEHADPRSIYEKARFSGIDYGAHFALLLSLRRDGEEALEARLAVPQPGTGLFSVPHVLHPAALDAAFHALFDYVTLGDPATKTWLPIRFERLTVWRPGADVHGCSIRVDKSGEQLKTVTLFLHDGEGRQVARLDRALLRAMAKPYRSPLQGIFQLDQAPAGCGVGPLGASLARRVQETLETVGVPPLSDGWLLLRAHMRAALAEKLRGEADGNASIDPSALLVRAGANRGFVTTLLGEALAGEILERDGERLRLIDKADMPSAKLVLEAVIAEFPSAAADVALSAQAAAALDDVFAGRAVAPARAPLVQHAQTSSLRLEPICSAVAGMVRSLASERQGARLHVLVAEENGAALIAALIDCAAEGTIRLSIAAADSTVAERLRRRLAPGDALEILDLSIPGGPCADIAVVCVPPEQSLVAGRVEQMAKRLQWGGALVMARPPWDNVVAFHHALPDETHASVEAPLSQFVADVAELEVVGTSGDSGEGGQLLVARRCAEAIPSLGLMGPGPIGALRDAFRAEAVDVTALQANGSALNANSLLWLGRDDGDADSLAADILSIKGLLLHLRETKSPARLWILACGPDRDALRAFVRVAMNEFAELDIRFIASRGDWRADAAMLAARIANPGRERELLLQRGNAHVSRLREGLVLRPAAEPAASAVRLHFPRPGLLENFHWVDAPRPDPGPGEVEVEVIATGLNFRDVMLAMGLLADDVLDEGLAGAVHGLECAGRVTRIGSGEVRHAVGDIVIGFAQNSFASHALGPAAAFVPLPEGLSPDAGAGLPTAFFTAWYALVELARLAPGETVLVHGGAGGVGLAAIQIAVAAGAKVIATVSSPDKAALARLYGAEAIYDSRRLDFADQVHAAHGGVDVVLNSLSGEAMRASLKCLRARGRFIELGKRDYVANSLLALRPFRRNLSYFGVDVDQILALDPELTVKGLEAIAAGFADGTFMPLPVMRFRASQIGEAFRLMQSAGHVGKIVVTAPTRRESHRLGESSFAPAPGVHLVVGGTRGFGLATALWLADKGADKIVVASRSGTVDPQFADAVEVRRAAGVTFEAMMLDVTDEAAVTAAVARISQEHGALGGVWHSAVTLADGLIEGMGEADLADVLAPKALGATHLDMATRGQPLGQFVLFSSASALLGNPGQGAYAAANGALEGLARRRRAEGLPALAIQWGAIADVGLLADRGGTMESLRRVAGVSGMQSAEALDRLEKVLALSDRLFDPVVTCSDFSDAGPLFALPVPASPAFSTVLGQKESKVATAGQSLAEMIAGLGDADALRLIVDLLAEEAAGIMRLAVADVDLDASIDSLGMDSLMALELRMSIEGKYRIELPMMAISAVGNLRELAQRILVMLRGGADREEALPLSDAESALIAIHGGGDAVSMPAPARYD